jgi:hypothetical protein
MTDETQADDRLAAPFDAALHLLDRQIVDRDGAMVGKVDDVELADGADGSLRVSGLLLGPAALLPRFGGERLGRWLLGRWRTLAVSRADRMVPGRIDVADVDRLTSDLRLTRTREDVVVPQPQATGAVVLRRLDHLMDMEVRTPDGREDLRILDVRLEPSGGLGHERVVVAGFVAGRRGRPGSMLGYDRSSDQGPWLVARVVRRLHRHSVLVPMSQVSRIDWERGVIETTGETQPLRHARATDDQA